MEEACLVDQDSFGAGVLLRALQVIAIQAQWNSVPLDQPVGKQHRFAKQLGVLHGISQRIDAHFTHSFLFSAHSRSVLLMGERLAEAANQPEFCEPETIFLHIVAVQLVKICKVIQGRNQFLVYPNSFQCLFSIFSRITFYRLMSNLHSPHRELPAGCR